MTFEGGVFGKILCEINREIVQKFRRKVKQIMMPDLLR